MTNPNPSPELLQRARLTLADARIAAGSLIGDCPDDVAVSAMLSFAALSQTPPAPSLSTDVQSAAAVFHEQDVSLKVALPAPGEVEGSAIGRALRETPDEVFRHIVDAKDVGHARARIADLMVDLRASLATVAAANDEGVARIIAPDAGWDRPEQSWMSTARADALGKAHQIIRLLSQGGGKA